MFNSGFSQAAADEFCNLFDRYQAIPEEIRKAKKKGQCKEIRGFNDCCPSCHDWGRFDTHLEEVVYEGQTLRVCCHAAQFLREIA